MNRRKFVTISSLSLLSGISAFALPITSIRTKQKSYKRKIIKPKRLEEGDRIGVVAPASFITEEDFEKIKSNLETLNLIAIPSRNLFKKSGYLAGSDTERVDDLHQMFIRRDIDAIICARGGYGSPRLLKMINYDLIRRNPKIFIGYSDITALLIAIHKKTGLVTFHGAVGISTFNEFTKNYFIEILFNGNSNVELESQPEEKREDNSSIEGILKISGGKAEGNLIGGNLSLLVNLMGTEFDFSLDKSILFLEEVGEEPYRIDRMLTQLINSNRLKKCRAIVLGQFSNCEIKKENPAFSESFNLYEVLVDRLGNLNIPVIYGLSFGHITNKFTLPIGIKSMIDVDNEKFVLLENAVV